MPASSPADDPRLQQGGVRKLGAVVAPSLLHEVVVARTQVKDAGVEPSHITGNDVQLQRIVGTGRRRSATLAAAGDALGRPEEL